MEIVIVGAGPSGLYLSILMKLADSKHRIVVCERNRPHDTFGFGVVFSDATLDNFARADGPSYHAIRERFAHWDDIDIHYGGQVTTSRGHGFAGMERATLLDVLAARATELGVELRFQEDVSDLERFRSADLLVGADGVNSMIRGKLAGKFEPSIDSRPNRFVWLGTTFPFRAFTFYFKENAHGLFRVHAYRYSNAEGNPQTPISTFIVECTDETFKKSGLKENDEEATIAYCEKLFAEELAGHPLLKNRSLWRQFPTVRNAHWHDGRTVLVGDAAHTAHFSIGSGTKLAMEDSIALRDALVRNKNVAEALTLYEAERRPVVESLQRAAQTSLAWFEETERYFGRLAPPQFALNLLTRSLRITHENLQVRDPALIASVDKWFAAGAAKQSRVAVAESAEGKSPPPMFTPFRLRDLVLENRVVVSPMCQYSADHGVPNDWHLVHLGSRAIGGAGLIITEMTDVSPEGRITPGCAGIWDAKQVEAWKRTVDFVHHQSTAKIGIQLAHAGRKASTRVPWEGVDMPLSSDNWPIVAPSAIPYREGSQTPKAMDRVDMDKVRADFVRSTGFAHLAGFDLIELHFAHGYLFSSFISPLANRRTDEYGGSLENRLRFPLEVFDAVRAAWPKEKPISVRISAFEWAPGGISASDSVQVARALKAHGADIIDVSTGGTVSNQKPEHGRLYQTPFSERIRHEAEIPTMTVGAITSYADVNSILAAGRADLCVLARGHLFDPYWTRHAAYEQGVSLPWPKQYASITRFRPRLK